MVEPWGFSTDRTIYTHTEKAIPGFDPSLKEFVYDGKINFLFVIP